jgi:Flp pilus assembly pilin Flp
MPVNRKLKDFLDDELGAELVEWAVVTLVLLAVAVPVLLAIGDELARIFNDILSQLERIPEG